MAGGIRTSIFRAFNSVYQIAGGMRGLDKIDTLPPIQIVSDLHRMAELGAANGRFQGFQSVSLVADHATQVTEYGTANVYDSTTLAALNTTEQDVWCWAIEVSARLIGGSTLSGAVLTGKQAGVPGAITTHNVLYYRADGSASGSESGGDALIFLANAQAMQGPYPKLIPPNTTLNWRSTIAAAGGGRSTVCQLLVWYGPRGILPPGLY